MTKTEALDAMKSGKKVSHEYYTPGEYLYMKDGHIFTEEGYDTGTELSNFWLVIQKWQTGWSVVN